MKSRNLVHEDLSSEQGLQLLDGFIRQVERSKRQNATSTRLFGRDPGALSILKKKRDAYSGALNSLQTEKLWLVRESSSMHNTLSIDATWINEAQERVWNSYRIVCTVLGWKALSPHESPADFDGVLEMNSELFKYYEDSFNNFLKKAHLKLDMALLPIKNNLENLPESGYIQIKI